MARRKQKRSMEAPQKLKLLITVVNREKADYFMDLLQEFEINMQFRTAAQGTAGTDVLQMMGLAESEKAVIFSVIREDQVKRTLETIEERFSTIKGGKGIAYTVPMSGMIGASVYQFFSNNRGAFAAAKEEA